MFSVNIFLFVIFCLTLSVFCEEDKSEARNENEQLSRAKRGGLNMLRLGRGLQMLRLGKRAGLPMFRLGRSGPREPSAEQLEELLMDLLMQEEAEKNFVYPEYKSEFPINTRYRRSLQDFPEDQTKLDMPDFSKIPEGGEEGTYKEDMSDLYNGEYYPYENEVEKRQMNMLRLGKRPVQMLRLGKRLMNMLRLGKRPVQMLRLGKRAMNMLRLGKRAMNMLRLGKRSMNMLRLGKKSDEENTQDATEAIQ